MCNKHSTKKVEALIKLKNCEYCAGPFLIPEYKTVRVDSCMANFIRCLAKDYIITAGCCCGHGKYPLTVICKDDRGFFELISGIRIPRKRNFYRTDKSGIYYLPELLAAKNQ